MTAPVTVQPTQTTSKRTPDRHGGVQWYCNVYDIGDDDLARSYDPKKVAKGIRTPKLPDVDGQFECLLKRVKREKTEAGGVVLFEFKFEVTKSSTELVSEGACYTLAHFPGSGSVRNGIFWEKLTPFMLALRGESTLAADFNAAEALAEFKKLCDDDAELELDLGFRLTRKLEPARKDKKTGKYKPTQVNDDGSPKIFANDTYLSVIVEPAPAVA